MLEVFTIGGGEHLVNVFNAVAAWSGGGGFRSMLRVVMVMGLAYSLVVVAFSLDWRAWLNWFLQASLIYLLLLVPTVSVKITDRIDPSLAPATVDNVPLGLGVMASFTSQIGDWMTRTAETVFVMPNALALTSNGMVYGARLFDKAQSFQVTNAQFRANLDEHMKQCVFYDVLLGFKSMDALARSPDLWTDMGPGSPARSQKWVAANADNSTTATVIPCDEAYERLGATFEAEVDKDLIPFAKQAYPSLANEIAAGKLRAELPVTAGHLHGATPASAFADLRQVSMIDAFRAARESFSDASWDAYASQRADAQARNTYTSIAQQAMTWVLLLGIVLTVVFYAMFPVLFPLFLLPRTGVATLKGYATGFFYLAAWGPLYVVLHMVVMSRAADAVAAVSPTGPTLLVTEGIQAVNNDVATIAGFLMMSVPFLAAGLARGALAIAGQATSMLVPAQGAAEAAAIERTTGNYAYGNLSFANTTANQLQANKWDMAPSFASGFANDNVRNADGTSTGFMATGATVYTSTGGMSVLPFKPTVTRGQIAEMRESASESWTEAQQLRNAAQEAWAAGDRLSHAVASGFRSSSGFQSSAGAEQGSSTAVYDRRGLSATQGSSQSREIGQSTSRSESARDQYVARESARLGGDAGLGIGRGRGGLGGLLSGGGSIGYTQEASEVRQWDSGTSASRSDSSSLGQSSAVQDQHANGRDVQATDGTYARAGSFAQDERFSSDTRTAEAFYEHSRRLSREAAETEERARRLENAASYAESHGFSLSEDLSQHLASRYIEKQAGDLRDLNLPDLYRTDLTANQRAARDFAVRQILDDFIREPRTGVADRLEPPDLGDVAEPASFDVNDLRGAVGAPVRPAGRIDGAQDDRAARVSEIEARRGEVRDQKDGAEALRGEAVRGASDLKRDHQQRTNRAWFSER